MSAHICVLGVKVGIVLLDNQHQLPISACSCLRYQDDSSMHLLLPEFVFLQDLDNRLGSHETFYTYFRTFSISF